MCRPRHSTMAQIYEVRRQSFIPVQLRNWNKCTSSSRDDGASLVVPDEKASGLVVEPTFYSSLDLSVIDKSLSLQKFLERAEDLVVSR
ncbi:hypothetical protein TNCV_2259631 [Trichonephila clavipes]|nr:hypothetical protein TNCV_2259631 [Trichonephila clavipes]